MGLSFELVLIELLLLYGAKVNQKKTMCYCMLWFNPSLAAFHVSIYIKNAPNFLSTCKIKEVEAIDKLCVHQQIHYQHVCTNRYIISIKQLVTWHVILIIEALKCVYLRNKSSVPMV